MNKSYYMIVKLFLCYDVKSNKQTNKQEIKVQKILMNRDPDTTNI
jgi:hypothetical protein